ncbi:hypothetical protein P4O66_019887 [Electrophorus voltai]|uniref:G-protein coupled receptors family 2 profile 2 domain-containing protein n=1 Tax=Electrophorus voltai TaxID=2609070 RepID=A0AAD8ZYG9_9TELE|nr:hypothetical protein P4O66_019887 [Electrophorus voltai]
MVAQPDTQQPPIGKTTDMDGLSHTGPRYRQATCLETGVSTNSSQWNSTGDCNVMRTYGNCSVTCLDPKSICRSDSYNTNCTDYSSNYDNIVLKNETIGCYKCGSALEKPEGHSDIPFLHDISTTNLASVMTALTSHVLELMENKSTMSVSYGDVQGIFVKQKDPVTPDTVTFAYSSGTNLGVGDVKMVMVFLQPPENISSSDLNNLTYITSIGCGLALFFLCVALFMHFLIRQARASVSVHILINLFVALSLLNLTFLTNGSVANLQSLIACKLMAGFMHYCLLASFTWFGLEALHLCLQLVNNPATIKHYLTKICITGWGELPPAITVAVLFCAGKYNKLVFHTDSGNVERMCWIVDSVTLYVVNIGFYSIIFLFTLMTFIFMLRWLYLVKRVHVACLRDNASSGQSTNTDTGNMFTVMGLCSMLGLTWGFAFLAYGAMRLPAYYIFTILNSFQGGSEKEVKWLFLLDVHDLQCLDHGHLRLQRNSPVPSESLAHSTLSCFFSGFVLFIYYYKTSKLVGEVDTQSGEPTIVENPYDKPKIF